MEILNRFVENKTKVAFTTWRHEGRYESTQDRDGVAVEPTQGCRSANYVGAQRLAIEDLYVAREIGKE